jgi:hypothetical protein
VAELFELADEASGAVFGEVAALCQPGQTPAGAGEPVMGFEAAGMPLQAARKRSEVSRGHYWVKFARPE